MAFKADIINKYHETRQFNKHTLDAVVIELKFNEILETTFEKVMSRFYSEILNQFEFLDILTINELTANFNLARKSVDRQQVTQKKCYVFKNLKENEFKRVCVTPNSLSFEFNEPGNGNYTGFEDFYEQFSFLLSKLQAILSENELELIPQRLGLRKVNKINKINLIRYDFSIFLEKNDFMDEQLPKKFYKEITTSLDVNKEIVVRSGILQDNFILDFDISSDSPGFLKGQWENRFNEVLSHFNKIIFNLYCHYVGETFISECLKDA